MQKRIVGTVGMEMASLRLSYKGRRLEVEKTGEQGS